MSKLGDQTKMKRLPTLSELTKNKQNKTISFSFNCKSRLCCKVGNVVGTARNDYYQSHPSCSKCFGKKTPFGSEMGQYINFPMLHQNYNIEVLHCVSMSLTCTDVIIKAKIKSDKFSYCILT